MVIFGINTIENKKLADLEGDYTCIPWNPTYLNQLTLVASILPGFDEDMILKEVNCPNNIIGLFLYLQQNMLYDGFPTFLPCKMIMQNPNLGPTLPSRIITKFQNNC